MAKNYQGSYELGVGMSERLTNPTDVARAIWYALWNIFGSNNLVANSEVEIDLELSSPNQLSEVIQELSLEHPLPGRPPLRISRAWWYQRYPIFAHPHLRQESQEASQSLAGSIGTTTTDSSPSRATQSQLPQPPSTIYERYIDCLHSYFCLSIFGDSTSDVDLLHDWLNDPRVDEYWKDAGDRRFHDNWLQQRYQDAHVLPVLGSYRGTQGKDQNTIEPFAYFEIYWAAEDKISQAYPTEEFDRGIHMLVGSATHRGPHRVRSWLPSLAHYIFSADNRTQRILSEPDHRNLKMISYLEEYGFKKVKEHDMGHKVAAIMVLKRADFWRDCPL